jgi:hypothetical protein
MPLHSIDLTTIRERCRSRIEALEIWMRRIIREELTKAYGSDFINYKNSGGNFIIKSEIRRNINSRFSSFPSDFPRPIDAAYFENQMEIFCSTYLYENFFKKYLISFFPNTMPNGYTYLTFSLERIKDIRNNLSHSNSISVRDAEYVLSFTSDIIESFKQLYRMEGKQQEYNVPQIIKVTDSFGNVCIRKNFESFESFNFASNLTVC